MNADGSAGSGRLTKWSGLELVKNLLLGVGALDCCCEHNPDSVLLRFRQHALGTESLRDCVGRAKFGRPMLQCFRYSIVLDSAIRRTSRSSCTTCSMRMRTTGSVAPAIQTHDKRALREATAGTCVTCCRAAHAGATGPRHAPKETLLGAKPQVDNELAALTVVSPFGTAATQLDAAAWDGTNGGIDTFVVALGAQQAPGAVVSKQVDRYDGGFDELDDKGGLQRRASECILR
jgi:hypothetical protein